jgi:hypothetical protein
MEYQIGDKVTSKYHGIQIGEVVKLGEPCCGRPVIIVKYDDRYLDNPEKILSVTRGFVIDGWELA